MPKINIAAQEYPAKYVNNFWYKLIGKPSGFSLESRIFHSISVCLIVLAFIYIPYNLFAGLYIASVSCFALSIVLTYQYYYSRFHHRKHNNTIFGLTGIIIFTVNYFANAGIKGSTDLIWPVYLLLLFTISPYRQHLLWLIVYLVCFAVLHIVEYYYPTLVQYPFNEGRGQFIDRVTAFPIPVITIYIIIKYIRQSYDKERLNAQATNQEILLQKDLLEKSNAEKNKLMSIISHDMRAPLINIQNYLELLNENELDNELRPVLEKDLLAATNNTMQMLTNLLYWTRSQMEKPVLNLQEVNLFSVLENTLEMEKTLAVKKGIALCRQVDTHVTVMADVDMLQLVVRNLVSNAIKFTPKGGVINIDTQVLNNECKIAISDNGNGIDKHEQDKLFNLASAPAFGTNNEKGVGLGLLLCKDFIERQGGRIGFESTLGQGSSFFISVPLKAQQ